MSYVGVKEVARLLDVSEVVVRRLLRNGDLKGRKVGREWRLAKSAVDAFMKTEQPPEPRQVDRVTSLVRNRWGRP